MRLGYLTVPFLDRPLESALNLAVELGLDTVEIPAGGFFDTSHLDPTALAEEDVAKLDAAVRERGLEISALALHGNPVHPDDARRKAYDLQFEAACRVAQRLGVRRFTLLAGLPGAGPGARYPNWITFPFPEELETGLAWQWEHVLIPHWQVAARRAADHGVALCFEMVPGDCVFNPRAFLRLRDALDVEVWCNLDPSHFFHQGIDPVAAVHRLAGTIGHVHAKDAFIHDEVARVDGLFDTSPLGAVETRGWSYRTVGWGHGERFWRGFLGALRLAGYDDVVSIEHEDALLAREEGLRQAAELLRPMLPRRPREKAWWDEGT